MDIQIRPICLKDAQEINEIRRMVGVMENVLSIPSETIKRSEGSISGLDANTHQFVATVRDVDGNEKVIGCAGLSVFPGPRLRHSAGIGIMVHKAYQGNGAGQKLMEALLDVADNWLMLVRVELTAFTDNERAIKLYHKMGFEIEGTKQKAAIRNGQYADEYMMARIRNV